MMIEMEMIYFFTETLLKIREVIIQKKKVVNFHNFGPDPPPPKSCETSIFIFFTSWPENHYVQNRKNSPLKT